jgi:transcription elongation GreA/GreB family factor
MARSRTPGPDKAGPDKAELRAELVAALAAALDAAIRAHQSALEGATHAEARAENDKDTRALEQSYVARGQAQRVDDLRAAVAAVQAMALRRFGADDPIAAGALVVADEDGDERRLFVAPDGGGTALAGGAVQVVTPRSPLGRALCGKRRGDDLEVAIAGRARALSIVRVE